MSEQKSWNTHPGHEKFDTPWTSGALCILCNENCTRSSWLCTLPGHIWLTAAFNIFYFLYRDVSDLISIPSAFLIFSHSAHRIRRGIAQFSVSHVPWIVALKIENLSLVKVEINIRNESSWKSVLEHCSAICILRSRFSLSESFFARFDYDRSFIFRSYNWYFEFFVIRKMIITLLLFHLTI